MHVKNNYALFIQITFLLLISVLRRLIQPLTDDPCHFDTGCACLCRVVAKSAPLHFRLAAKLPSASLLLLSKSNPLRWASIWLPPAAALVCSAVWLCLFRPEPTVPKSPVLPSRPRRRPEPDRGSRRRRRRWRRSRAARSPARRTEPDGRSRT